MFLTKDEVLMEVKTLVKKYQCKIFNFVDLCSGVGIVWSVFGLWSTTVVDHNPNTSQ